MKKILITGGNGFIGRNFKEQLGEKYCIYAPSHSELDLLDEVEVRKFVKGHNFDVVIHSATENATVNAKRDLSQVFYNNLRMFFNLARLNDLYGKMYYFGSGAEYDKRHYEPKMKEDYFDTYVPSDDYGYSKYIMAKYTYHAINIYDLRLFGVFGKYEDWQIRFISNVCCKAIWDLPITIRQNVYFDYLYIDDLVRIMEWFIENKPQEKFYNVCTGTVCDLLTLAQKVLLVSGKNLPVIISKCGRQPEYSGNNKRLLAEIGNFKFEDFNNSISNLYKWYKLNKKLVEKVAVLK